MNLSTRVKYFLEDYSVGLGMTVFFLILGALVTMSIRYSLQDEAYEATITKLKSKDAHTKKEQVCNGDPVLLICGMEKVDYPAWYRVELTYDEAATEAHSRRGEVCSVYVDEAEYQALKLGMSIDVRYRDWDGCAVTNWPAKQV